MHCIEDIFADETPEKVQAIRRQQSINIVYMCVCLYVSVCVCVCFHPRSCNIREARVRIGQ
jgi:hypothetical protein